MDVDAIISDAATDNASKKKSNVPVMEIKNPTLEKRVRKYLDTYHKQQTTTGQLKKLEEEILPKVKEFHEKTVQDSHTVPATVKLMLADGKTVSVDLAKNQYSKIKVDEEPHLKEVFGEDYESFFQKKLGIALTDEALKDKTILTKLVKAVGQDNFKKYFKVEHCLVPTERLHQERFLDEEVKNKAEQVIDESVLKPYKPSFKAK